MKINNEKDIDNILNEYADAVGKTSDKSRDLGKLYAKKSEKREYRRPIMRRWAHVCVAAMLVCAILVSVPVFDESILHEYRDALFSNSGGITASSSSSHSSQNKGGVLDSISEWLESLKGDKGNNANNGNGNDQNKNDGNKNDGQIGKDSADGADGSTGKDGSGSVAAGDGATFTFDEAIAQDKSAREFFKDLITPKIMCKSVEVVEINKIAPAYFISLEPNKSKLQSVILFCVREDIVMEGYSYYKDFDDKLFWKGTTVSYKITKVKGSFLYSAHFNINGIDYYMDVQSDYESGIANVLTAIFG